MKKIFSIYLLFPFLINTCCSQTSFYTRFVIQLKDKNNNPYSIYNPSQYLSQKSIERRNKQNIIIDQTDIPITPMYLDSIRSTGVTVLNYSKWLNTVSVYTTDSLALIKITNFPFVLSFAEIAKKNKPKSVSTEVKKTFQMNSYLSETSTDEYGLAARQIEMINGTGLHQKGFAGQDMLIAVFDAGFRNADTHPVFSKINSEGRVVASRNFVSGGNNVINSSNHGTQCYSVIGAYYPNKMIGTAPFANFILCVSEENDAEYPIEEYNWVAAAEYADSLGVDVISSSVGYTTFDSAVFNHTYTDMNGITNAGSRGANFASQKGIIVCNSAGNSGDKPWKYISSPADASDIITVGAVDTYETYAAFSSQGPTADGRVKPDVCAQGKATVVANASNGDITTSNGTSFSCPIITGMTACLWQAHPYKTNLQIIEAIRKSSDRYTNPNNLYGYGIPDFTLADFILSNVDYNNINIDSKPIAFPNPFSQNISITYNSSIDTKAKILVYDMIGKLISDSTYVISKGYNQIVPTNDFMSKGIYTIIFFNDSDTYSLKVLKQ